MPQEPRSSDIDRRLTPLWTLALLGILLFPTNYRAGAMTAHGHSLFQLWADAADGRVQHHGAPSSDAASNQRSGFDPSVIDQTVTVNDQAASDGGDQSDSEPASFGAKFFVTSVTFSIAAVAVREPIVLPLRPLYGWSPAVPSPPPRQLPAAV